MRIHKRHGFTLVELLITVAVIVILIGIALVSYKEVAERAVDTKIKQEIVDLREALRLYHQKYQKMPNGSNDSISLCLIDHPSCRQARQGWEGPSVASVLPELRKVGYNAVPTAFFPATGNYNPISLSDGRTDYRYSYEPNPSYDDIYADAPPAIAHEEKLISAPMIRYKSDGSFYFLYFQDHRKRSCPAGEAVTLHQYWSANGTREACSSHPLDKLP